MQFSYAVNDFIRIQAKFVVASAEQILSPGQLVIGGGRVRQVTARCSESPDVELPDCAILPGFVNPHTHLEFSDLTSPIPAGENFPQWIGAVVGHRRAQVANASAEQLYASRKAAVWRGLTEAYRTGTVVVGDIVTPPWDTHCLQVDHGPSVGASESDRLDALAVIGQITELRWANHLAPAAGARVVAFTELLGLEPEKMSAACSWASRQMARESYTPPALHSFGFSPHAPYSIDFGQVQGFAKRAHGGLAAMHLAESRDELQWLAEGQGPFRKAYDRLGIPTTGPRPSIEQCLELLQHQRSRLIIHGNYLTESQIATVASSTANCVIYCPRTHSHFAHEPYPLDQFSRHGVRVAIGTDSRASSPDLNMFAELAEMRRKHPQCSPATALAMATCYPAEALGIGQEYGHLGSGAAAAAYVIPVDTAWRGSEDLIDAVTSGCDQTTQGQPLARLLKPPPAS